jgi:hypothetical protein
MTRPALLIAFLSCTILAPLTALAAEPELVRAFLDKRQIVGQIFFDEGSALLNSTGQSEVARLIPALQELNPERLIIRIEGFSTSAGSEPGNIRISMQRAQAVADYLSPRLGNIFYVTGCGSRHCGPPDGADRARADIVVYENSIELEAVPVEEIVQELSGRKG